jgi:hypothetical protein
MHTNAHECVWEKTTPLSGKNNTHPVLGVPLGVLARGHDHHASRKAKGHLDKYCTGWAEEWPRACVRVRP